MPTSLPGAPIASLLRRLWRDSAIYTRQEVDYIQSLAGMRALTAARPKTYCNYETLQSAALEERCAEHLRDKLRKELPIYRGAAYADDAACALMLRGANGTAVGALKARGEEAGARTRTAAASHLPAAAALDEYTSITSRVFKQQKLLAHHLFTLPQSI